MILKCAPLSIHQFILFQQDSNSMVSGSLFSHLHSRAYPGASTFCKKTESCYSPTQKLSNGFFLPTQIPAGWFKIKDFLIIAPFLLLLDLSHVSLIHPLFHASWSSSYCSQCLIMFYISLSSTNEISFIFQLSPPIWILLDSTIYANPLSSEFPMALCQYHQQDICHSVLRFSS